jgi:AraC-like DNA-binding protein
MDIYPVYLLNIVLIIVIVRISLIISDDNKYHLTYLILHFIFQLISTLNISIYSLFEVKAPIVLISIGRVFAFVFFYLFIKSIMKMVKSKLTVLYLIPVLLLIFFNHLNGSGIRLLDFTHNQVPKENILGFFISDFAGKGDLFFITFFNTLFFTFLIFHEFFKLKNTEILDLKKKGIVSDFIIYYYVPISITSITTLITISVYLQNIVLPYFVTLIKLIAIFTLLLLVIKPKLIRRLAGIKNIQENDNDLIRVFEKITNYFSTTDYFKDSKFMPANIAVDLGIRNELIRSSIKKFSNMTVPLYINSHRVEFACDLIKEGYLETYSMDAIAEKSGFSSQKNFNRVFKLIKSLTPSQYKDSFK